MSEDDILSRVSLKHEFECDICIDFCFWFLTQSMNAIIASAISGCRTCALLRDVIQSYSPELDDSTEFTVHKGSSIVDIIYTDPADVEPIESNRSPTRLTLFLKCSEDDNMYQVYPLLDSEIPPISGDTASQRANEFARNSLFECVHEHKACNTSGPHTLPTRVLDLQCFNNSSDLRLYESSGETAQYCALSHCWGKAQVIQLTQSMLSTYKERIQFDWLPKTFQDAVAFTRNLSVRYLWIDSLCIVQDTNDWESEASKMAAVYGGSHLTIAASKGTNAESGLFSAVGSEYALRRISFNQEDGRLTDVLVRRKIPHLDSEQGFPLLSRAWVLQERILSPRVLHFGPQELLWECMEACRCECSFVNDPSLSDRMAKRKQSFMCLFDDTCPPSHGLDLWRSIISQYSRLELTYSKDMLSALAGLAQRSQSLIGADYMAGMWFNTALPGFLLWRIPSNLSIPYATDFNHLSPRLTPAKAPTWSWVSVKAPIEFPDYYGLWSPCSRLGCSYDALNQFTGMPKGRLRVATPLVFVSLQRNGGRVIEAQDRKIAFKENEIALVMEGEKIDNLSCYLDYDIWEEDADEVPDGSDLLCAVVGYSWKKDDYPGSITLETSQVATTFANATVHCLILNPYTDSGATSSDDVEESEQDGNEGEPSEVIREIKGCPVTPSQWCKFQLTSASG